MTTYKKNSYLSPALRICDLESEGAFMGPSLIIEVDEFVSHGDTMNYMIDFDNDN